MIYRMIQTQYDDCIQKVDEKISIIQQSYDLIQNHIVQRLDTDIYHIIFHLKYMYFHLTEKI